MTTQNVNTEAANTIDLSFAQTPNDIDLVPSLVKELSSLEKNLGSSDSNTRIQMIEKAQALVRALQTPRDMMIEHLLRDPIAYAVVAFGVQVGLFVKMAESQSPKTVSSLAKDLDINEDVLRRLMRHLGAVGYLEEIGVDEYKPTHFSRALTLPFIGDSYSGCLWFQFPVLAHLPEVLQSKHYVPSSNRETIFNQALKTDLKFFEYLQTFPKQHEWFNNYMGGFRLGTPRWMEQGYYPMQQNLIDNFDMTQKDAVLIVDVGGGLGQDLAEFQRKFPDAPGRLILEDISAVLEQIEIVNPKIERIGHNFFEEQPVKGARAYYLHSVLHDWPDEDCIKIVEQIKKAMKPAYSKLLINENVLTTTGASWEASGLDLLMMTCFGSRERTTDDWTELLGKKCNMEICRIWYPSTGTEAMIECELRENKTY